jgi:hypothetical protein
MDLPHFDIMAPRGTWRTLGRKVGVGRCASLDKNERYNKASMSTTHDVVNVSQDTTRQDMYLVGSELCGVARIGSTFPDSRPWTRNLDPYLHDTLSSQHHAL